MEVDGADGAGQGVAGEIGNFAQEHVVLVGDVRGVVQLQERREHERA